MDWDRAKTIIIILLCALNVFLLGNYLYGRHMRTEASQTQEELAMYLENRGVRLSCELPQMAKEKRSACIAPDAEVLASAALKTILGRDAAVRNGEAVSASGRISWIAGEINGEIHTLPSGTIADLDAILQLLADAGVHPDSVDRQGREAVLTKTFGDTGLVIYNFSMRITALENGGWGISGHWHLGDPSLIVDDMEHDPAGLLVTFADQLLTQNIELTSIDAMESGWVATVLTNVGTKYTPVYKVTTNAGIYYLNAIDAQLISIT